VASEDSAAKPIGPSEDDRPELLIKLQERKVRHKQRNLFERAGVVLVGILVVCAGIVMSGPGVPGPGILTIIAGLGFLALEFDWAERWLERVIRWGDRAAQRAERTSTKQRIVVGIAMAAGIAAFAIAAIEWDIPLVPVL
jgi:uncharacterized protein (TIGR02611 family)